MTWSTKAEWPASGNPGSSCPELDSQPRDTAFSPTGSGLKVHSKHVSAAKSYAPAFGGLGEILGEVQSVGDSYLSSPLVCPVLSPRSESGFFQAQWSFPLFTSWEASGLVDNKPSSTGPRKPTCVDLERFRCPAGLSHHAATPSDLRVRSEHRGGDQGKIPPSVLLINRGGGGLRTGV